MQKLYAFCFALLIFSCSAQSDSVEKLELINLKVKDIALSVEYADEHHERAKGLMFREELCDNCGMLFKFDSIRTGSMWMKNTLIPLDVAYISAFGKITDIKAMQPGDLTTVSSSVPVLFALEMNQGWFEQNNIKVGDMISLPAKLR